jgi:glycosyltransferase involved in cell wall biosynthesis
MKLSAFNGPADVLGLWFHPNAAAYYRLDLPITAAGGSVLEWQTMKPETIEPARTLVVNRMGLDTAQPLSTVGRIFDLLRDNGKRRILVDWDDDLTAVPAHNTAISPIFTQYAVEALRRADGVVVTNSTLAGRVKKYNKVIYVVPNYIRASDWHDPVERDDSDVWFVVAGSSTHSKDWEIVNRALHNIKKQRRDVKLRALGYLPPYLADICDDFIPWTSIEAYQSALYGNDVGLCPLPDSAFNRCKSPIKAYEYALAGLAVIASPTQYGPILEEGRGLVCITEQDWERAIIAYADDAARRKRDAAALRRYVIDTRDIRSVDLSLVYK